MSIRFAFTGFRHGHVLDLYNRVTTAEDLEVAAACEEDETARAELEAKGTVRITHTRFGEMLDRVPCDVVAIGDYYAHRGSLAAQALAAGKHVISDKPLCTRLSEVVEIERLSREKGLKVGCMLTMRDSAQMIGVQSLIREGTIGAVHAIAFGGQHPLLPGSRPQWYFEPGKHGGTINDIGVHAVDVLPWATGLQFSTVNAARCWNAFVPEFPHFQDGAQMMLTMNNGCGVLGDVSYFMPDRAGYSLPQYWRMTFFGRKGMLETSASAKEIALVFGASETVERRPLPPGNPGGYLQAFLSDIRGEAKPGELDTAAVLKAARTVLTIQQAADENACNVRLS